MVQKNFRIETIHNAFNYDILITTYSLLRNDINDYVNIKFNIIILDEAQNIKNYISQNSIAAKSLKAKNKFLTFFLELNPPKYNIYGSSTLKLFFINNLHSSLGRGLNWRLVARGVT